MSNSLDVVMSQSVNITSETTGISDCDCWIGAVSRLMPTTAAAVAETVFLDSETATATQASKAFIEPNILAIDEKSDSRRQLVVVLLMEREFPRGSSSKRVSQSIFWEQIKEGLGKK